VPLGRCLLDLRLQQKAFQTYLQFAADRSVSHWEDLVAASVRSDLPLPPRGEHELAGGEEARRRNVVRELFASISDSKERERAYTEKTGALSGRLLPPEVRGGQQRVRRVDAA